MFTEQEFREAFRVQVDDEVAEVVGPHFGPPSVPSRPRRRWPAIVGAAAAVVAVLAAGVAGTSLLDRGPRLGAFSASVEAVTADRAIVVDLDVADVTLQAVDGCLAIAPDTLLVVNEPVWEWDGAERGLRWLLSSQSDGFELGDEFRLGGERVAVGAADVALPASCADFDGTLWLAGTPDPPHERPRTIQLP